LDNQREDGQTPFYGACTCGISIHSKLSPDSPAVNGEKDAVMAGFANRQRCGKSFFLPVHGEKCPAGQ
ncbi:hypothetical protein NKI38_15245, partial [Mesorhizobium sp. M0621]|uniref:hypothetical protein n=1 Tax=Mesorhizobium sp. M0621 TaxID=2956974 RepID=UPI00333C1672